MVKLTSALFWPGLAFLAGIAGALVVRAISLAGLERWTSRSSTTWALGTAIRTPSFLWCAVFGLYVASEVALEASHLPPRLHAQVALVLEAAVVLSVTVTLAGLVGVLVGRASERQVPGGVVTGLAQTTARVIVIIVGLLILLSVFGVQITPILTALGVGGLAVALALQDSLANLFAGLHLLADKPVRVGDYVKLGDNVEGFVLDVGWRSTRVRSLSNNVVVVPNQMVARGTITNYDLPEPRLAIGVKVSVDYAADPHHVAKLLLEEALKAAGQVPGLLATPSPEVRLSPGFGEYSLEFTVGCHVGRFVDQYAVQHELRFRILDRLRAEGIALAVPARVIRVSHEREATPASPARNDANAAHHA
jgi:small-conductance mechanosensitive channel